MSKDHWTEEQAWTNGYIEGYRNGTQHMRKAYEQNKVPKAPVDCNTLRKDAGMPQAESEFKQEIICRHDDIEDAENCPNGQYELQHVTTAKFPPDYK
jgi:hypothetical protein